LYLLAEEMDRKDEEMREVVKKVWPAQARKMLDNLVPPNLGKYWWNLLISLSGISRKLMVSLG
jgi:hypothetical protein